MITTRSYSPATEYTSDTPGMSAMAWAASGISSISHCTSTTALTICPFPWSEPSGPSDPHGHAPPAADAQRAQREGEVAFAELVGGRQHDARPGHPDRVAERDAAALRVQLVVVELELALARKHL